MRAEKAFTLVELMVSVAILALIVVFVSQMVNSATALTTAGNKRMDTDSQARLLLDRIAVDFTQMVRRIDVDYFVKQPSNTQTGSNTVTGANDQIAFFSSTSGYSPQTASLTTTSSPLTLVVYRVNTWPASQAYNRFERMGKSLAWNSITPPPAVTPTPLPMVFLPSTISGIPTWSGAVRPSPDPNYSDPDYELAGPNVFRFEYYYLLKNGSLSDTPWDAAAGHTVVAGMQDVAAICVVIAVIDPRSRLEIPVAQLDAGPTPGPSSLAAQMRDFSLNMHQPGGGPTKAGDLAAQWQSVLDAATTFRVPVTGIRIYQRNFYLSPVK